MKEVKLLGVTIDSKLTFNSHIHNLCVKANQKINALIHIQKFLMFEKTKILSNAYIFSPFNYCSPIWTFCTKGAYNEIKKTQKRALRLLDGNFQMNLDELLNKYKSYSVHILCIKYFMMEIYKSLKGHSLILKTLPPVSYS